jgi:hypothetical protein
MSTEASCASIAAEPLRHLAVIVGGCLPADHIHRLEQAKGRSQAWAAPLARSSRASTM